MRFTNHTNNIYTNNDNNNNIYTICIYIRFLVLNLVLKDCKIDQKVKLPRLSAHSVHHYLSFFSSVKKPFARYIDGCRVSIKLYFIGLSCGSVFSSSTENGLILNTSKNFL